VGSDAPKRSREVLGSDTSGSLRFDPEMAVTGPDRGGLESPGRRRRLIEMCARIARVLWREGCGAVAHRKAARIASALAERLRIWRLARRPWQADGRPVFLLVTHRCGGGTERHVRDLASGLHPEGVRVVMVRPSSRGKILWEEYGPDHMAPWCRESSPDRLSIARMLTMLAPAHAHVHHVMGLPDTLVDLLQESGVRYDWSIHDYHVICPCNHLVRVDGVYCGEPDVNGWCEFLVPQGNDQGQPASALINSWRERFSGRLGGARRVFAPSQDAARRVSAHFPGATLVVRPHPERYSPPDKCAAAYEQGEVVHVVLLGTITTTKGSEKLLACAQDARTRGLALAFTVLGTTDRDACLKRVGNVRVTGAYREHEVFDRLRGLGCSLAFLPSVWPETFMFTLSIAMAARLYVVCFELGAQAERLARWGWGRTLPLDSSPQVINDALIASAGWLASRPAAPPPPPPAAYPDLLRGYYGFGEDELARMGVGGSALTSRAAFGTTRASKPPASPFLEGEPETAPLRKVS
jgi:Glycosyltransferase Family 4